MHMQNNLIQVILSIRLAMVILSTVKVSICENKICAIFAFSGTLTTIIPPRHDPTFHCVQADDRKILQS
jgi:hypothetical protein